MAVAVSVLYISGKDTRLVMSTKKENKEELMELKHDAVPGYKPVFMVVFAASCLYMAYILSQPCF